MLVRDRDRCAVCAAALAQLPDPGATPVCVEAHPAPRRPRSMDEALASSTLPPFPKAQQALRPSGSIVAGPQPQPGSPWTAVLAGAGSADRGHQGRRTSGAPPGHRPQPWTRGMGRGQGCERLLGRGELCLQGGPRVNALPTPLLAERRALVLRGLQGTDHGVATLRHPCGDHDPRRVQEPMPCMPQGRARDGALG